LLKKIGKHYFSFHAFFPGADSFWFSVAVYKRSTLPVFKAHGKAQASISDCVTETFSAIRTVSSH